MPSQARSFYAALPPPLRFGLIAVVGFVAFSLVKNAGWWLVAAAAVLWAAVGLGLAKHMGALRTVTSLPVLDALLSRLISGAPAVTPAQRSTSGAPVSTANAAASPTPDRRAVGEAAFKEIDALVGIEEVQQRIEGLLALGRAAHNRGQPGFGTGQPAVLVVLSGACGTGKSTVANALPRLLFGQGVIQRPDVVELHPHDVATHPAAVPPIAEQKAAESAGGVLLIDDADWLCGAAHGAGAPIGQEIGRGILRAALARPGAVTVIVAGGPDFGSALLQNREQQAVWLNKLHVVQIQFEDLSETWLLDIFGVALRRENAALGDGARENLVAAVRDEVRSGGDRFSNALAMQRLAGRAIEAASRRTVTEGGSGGRLLVEARDMRALTQA